MQKQIEVNDKKYCEVFSKVSKDWNNLVKQSIETKVSTADIISYKYKISYAVAADIASSIALSISIR